MDMLKRNYKEHLKDIHNEEKDKRGLDQPTLQFQQKQCVSERDNLPGSTCIEQAGGSGSSDLHLDPDIELTNIIPKSAQTEDISKENKYCLSVIKEKTCQT